jgi:hypothetical protein
MAGDIRFKHPRTCIIGEPMWSGKSTLCVRFLQNLDSLCTKPNFSGGIIWCYSEQSAVLRQQLNTFRNNVQIREGVPENFENGQGLAWPVKLGVFTCRV